MTDLEIGQLIRLSHLPAISLYVYIVSDGANFGSYLAIEDSSNSKYGHRKVCKSNLQGMKVIDEGKVIG
jgi:hypothetical protein